MTRAHDETLEPTEDDYLSEDLLEKQSRSLLIREDVRVRPLDARDLFPSRCDGS